MWVGCVITSEGLRGKRGPEGLGETQVKSVGDGQYECDACGATFSVGDTDDEPHTTIVAASGQPLTRIVDVRRKEVHRCRDGRAKAGRRSERHDANG